MSDPAFIVSRPPYDADGLAPALARVWGLTPMEVRQRLLFPLPEIWCACATEGDARTLSDQLRAAGVDTWVLAKPRLTALPPVTPVAAFVLEAEALAVETHREGNVLRLPWHSISHFLMMLETTEVARAAEEEKPKDDTSKGMKRAAMAMNLMAPGLGSLVKAASSVAKGKRAIASVRTDTVRRRLADLYAVVEGGGMVWLRLAENAIGYAGLAEKMQSTAIENWQVLITELHSRLPHVQFDEKAVRLSPRTPTLMAPPAPCPAAVPGRLPPPIDLYSALMFLSP